MACRASVAPSRVRLSVPYQLRAALMSVKRANASGVWRASSSTTANKLPVDVISGRRRWNSFCSAAMSAATATS